MKRGINLLPNVGKLVPQKEKEKAKETDKSKKQFQKEVDL